MSAGSGRRRLRRDHVERSASRRRRPLTFLPSWRTTLLPTGVLLALAVPFAVAAGGQEDAAEDSAARAARTGDALREGRRNPRTGDARRETELIGDIDADEGGSGAGKGGYVLRESNLSTTGGGPVHGCRAVRGNIDTAGFNASARNTKPCIRASNLSSGPNGGRAFEFSFGGPLGGLFEHDTGGNGVSPFATNATGVARGLNADRLDSREASDFLLRTEKAASASSADTAANADRLGGRAASDYVTTSQFVRFRVALAYGESREFVTNGPVGLVAECRENVGAQGQDELRILGVTREAGAFLQGDTPHSGPGVGSDTFDSTTPPENRTLGGIVSTQAGEGQPAADDDIDNGFVAGPNGEYIGIDETTMYALHVGGSDCLLVGHATIG